MTKPRLLLSVTNDNNDFQIEQVKSARQTAARLGADLEIVYAQDDGILQSQEAGPNYFAEVMDCECPNCDFLEAPMLAIVNYSLGDGTDQRPRILKLDQP